LEKSDPKGSHYIQDGEFINTLMGGKSLTIAPI